MVLLEGVQVLLLRKPFLEKCSSLCCRMAGISAEFRKEKNPALDLLAGLQRNAGDFSDNCKTCAHATPGPAHSPRQHCSPEGPAPPPSLPLSPGGRLAKTLGHPVPITHTYLDLITKPGSAKGVWIMSSFFPEKSQFRTSLDFAGKKNPLGLKWPQELP